MISENERRDWIEVGAQAALASAYWVVAKILAVNILIGAAFVFFPPPEAIATFFMGITMGLLIFTINSVCTVKADKISRKEVRANG